MAIQKRYVIYIVRHISKGWNMKKKIGSILGILIVLVAVFAYAHIALSLIHI